MKKSDSDVKAISDRDYLKLLLDEERRKCRASLAFFCRCAWHVIEPGKALAWNWHLDALCEHLEAVTRGEITRLVVNVPPRSTKSTIVGVMWPAWIWLRDRSKQILSGSHGAPLAIRDALKTRRLVESDWFSTRWPAVKFASDQNQKTRYDVEGGGHRIVFGMGSGVTGEGGDVLVVDDPHPAKGGMWSDANREAVKRSFDLELSTRLNDPNKSAIVIIMQRLHEDDLAGHVLGQGGWVHLRLPMEFEASAPCITHLKPRRVDWPEKVVDGWKWDKRTTDGELLHPARFDREYVDRLKAVLGPFGTAGQLQQREASAEGAELKAAWTRQRFTTPPTGGEWIQSWDLKAGSKDPRSSYAVGQVWCKPHDNPARRYLVHQVRGQWDIVETIAQIEALSAAYPQASAKVIEDKADGKAVVRMLRDRISGLILRKPEGDKLTRLRSVLPSWEAANVWLPADDNVAWVVDLIKELTTFPAAAHDDQVDAMTQALAYFDTAHVVRAIAPPMESGGWRGASGI